MDDREVEAILADPSKRVSGDLAWAEPSPGAVWVKFSTNVENEEGRPLRIVANYNRILGKISINLLHPEVKGRLYSLDIGGAHAFPDGTRLEETHKHLWSRDQTIANVYVPDDITAKIGQVEIAWREFCAEAKIVHEGELQTPPPLQEQLSW